MSESREGHPLIVIIDELDRCRPSYAVELLEVAKHLFAVDHIVFVLAINRSELAHSIKALYGDGFDAVGYLGRFFDLDFRLPEPDRVAFIDTMHRDTGIYDFFERPRYPDWPQEAKNARNLLQAFLVTSDLSLRQIAQAIHRLGLVFASLPESRHLFASTTTVMFILRTIDLDLYVRFIDGEASDLEVFETVIDRAGIKDLNGNENVYQFGAIIIMCALREGHHSYSTVLEQSPLYKHFQEQAPKNEKAQRFIQRVAHYFFYSFDSTQETFKESIQRIELISTDFID